MDVPRPRPSAEEVLVRVRASALNRADLAMLTGASHGGAGGGGRPLGLEWAGEVIEAGAEVQRWKVGDRVMASGGGAFAEYAVGHDRRMYAIPEGLGFEQAAGLPVALQTMHDAIATNGKLQPGQSVLILGASSGVGLMGLQVAKTLGAGLVIGTSTSPDKRVRLADFGADLAVDTRSPDWVTQVLEATGGHGVDLVIDQLAGPLIRGTFKATRIGGRVVNVGRLAGLRGEFDFDLHALRRIDYVGVTFRTRSAAQVETITALTAEALGPALAAGRLRLPVDQVAPLEEGPAALRGMADDVHFGKIVLTPGSEEQDD
jgi:NADPH2:quinone reductase